MRAALTARVRVIRRRAPSNAVAIARLAIPAMVAYLIAEWILGSEPPPLLAPLTALLVVQVSLYHTVHSAIQRILSVTVGVMVAILLARLVGFAWWSLGLAIVAALALGLVLKLGDHYLEVPISAMLIFQLGTEAAATDRIVETAIGAGVGLLVRFVAAPVRVQPAEVALSELGGSMTRLLRDMADGLRTEPDATTTNGWYERAHELGREIRRVEREIDAAEESVRLNIWALSGPMPGPRLRLALETLERATSTIRGMTRSIADRTHLYQNDRGGLGEQMWEGDVRERLAGTLSELATAGGAYVGVATTGSHHDVAELDRALDEGRRQRAELGEILREDPGHWPLHGELLVHLDRLLDGLRDGRVTPYEEPHRPRPRGPLPRPFPPRRSK
jgi:uncharacterized membrane protein YgaE (UPF0421/DUF939 family)